jgi:hypothetical protein
MNRARKLSPQRHSLVQATTSPGRGTFHALAPGLRQVTWPNNFKPGPINKYDGSSNPEEFIQAYHMVIEATGGDNLVKTNYLPTTLIGVARSWLINLSEGKIYN